MPSIFTRIAQREIPGHFVAENDEFFAILDINPLKRGHVLVIPKTEVDHLFDLSPEILTRYFQFAQRVGKAIKSTVPCERIGMSVIGLEVPHAHIHLIPINVMDDMNFSRPKLSFTNEELAETAEAIKAAFI